MIILFRVYQSGHRGQTFKMVQSGVGLLSVVLRSTCSSRAERRLSVPIELALNSMAIPGSASFTWTGISDSTSRMRSFSLVSGMTRAVAGSAGRSSYTTWSVTKFELSTLLSCMLSRPCTGCLALVSICGLHPVVRGTRQPRRRRRSTSSTPDTMAERGIRDLMGAITAVVVVFYGICWLKE